MTRKATTPREPSAAELREVLPPIDATPEQLARAAMRRPPMTQQEVRARTRARKKSAVRPR